MADSPSAELPEFAVVVRGYDREQVDTYMGELLALVHEMRAEVCALRAQLEAAQPGAADPDQTQPDGPVEVPSAVSPPPAPGLDEAVVELQRRWQEKLDELEGIADQLVRFLATARGLSGPGPGTEARSS